MFTHLHVHTEYSLLDGMCRIKQLVARAKELGMKSLAITDHGVLYGVIQFYLAAKEAGIKPIIGVETYVAPAGRAGRTAGDKSSHHIVLLAKNQTGYRNLLQLITRANLEGFYYKARVDKELLREYHEGLVALSSCIAGEIPRLILDGRMAEAKETALWYKQTFTDYYLEIQKQPVPEQETVNRGLLALSRELGIPVVATNDVHYVNREDAAVHDLLLCVGTNTTVNDAKRMKMPGDYFYLKSSEEMAEAFNDVPEALANTERIADMCNLTLDFGRLHLPEIDRPTGKTPDQYLSDLCYAGLSKYYPEQSEEIKNRLEYELDVIQKTQFANYFLVVWDIISFVRKNNILYGVRGSAAASIVLRCLGITEIDPIATKLVFERFLNIERREMPDIDMDFQDDRREEVIEYVSQKYGQDHVAQIITFGTLGARAALRDIGRALGMSYGDVDAVVRLVPFAVNMTLDKALEENADLRNVYEQDEIVRKLIDTAKKVEGISRHASTHAAGVVISKEPLTKHIPLQRISKGENENAVMTQYVMEDIAKIGLLKMDFLGLSNLTSLGRACEIIRQNRGIEIDLHRIPMDDQRTFTLLASGETAGVFQLEGAGMRKHIKDLKPTTFSDIAAMVALYRPGPMEHIPTFIKGKHGEVPIEYLHPALASILEETYGVIVYQEQVLFIVQALASYTLGQADIFRKAMGKKIAEVMKKEKQHFLDGAREKGFSDEIASAIFAMIEPFAGYAFNKAHATSYALVAYQTAYLKANYPVEYMTALLMTYSDQTEKVASFIAECRRLGITILPPDINHSEVSFSIEKRGSGALGIRFGLAAVKNVGTGAVEPIIAERNTNGLYKSVEDLCRRTNLQGINKRVLESLVKVGALDCLGSRAGLLKNIDGMLSLAQREQRLRDSGQATMFDFFGTSVPTPLPGLDLKTEEAPIREKLAWEKELTGVYLSDHPLSSITNTTGEKTILCGQIHTGMAGQTVVIAGMITTIRPLMTKEKRAFISAVLEDLDGHVEVMVWPKIYEGTRPLWQEGETLLVEGKVKIGRDGQAQVTCDRVRHFEPQAGQQTNHPANHKPNHKEEINHTVKKEEPVAAKTPESTPLPEQTCKITLKIAQTEDEETDIAYLNKLVAVLKEFPGRDTISLRVSNGTKIINMKLSNISTHYCPELQQKLVEMVGEEGLSVVPVSKK